MHKLVFSKPPPPFPLGLGATSYHESFLPVVQGEPLPRSTELKFRKPVPTRTKNFGPRISATVPAPIFRRPCPPLVRFYLQSIAAAIFIMGLDDDSRIVVKHTPPVVPPSPKPTHGRGNPVSNAPLPGSSLRTERHSNKPRVSGRKPDGHGTVMCTHTFTTGLVVTTCSNGTVRDLGVDLELDRVVAGLGKGRRAEPRVRQNRFETQSLPGFDHVARVNCIGPSKVHGGD